MDERIMVELELPTDFDLQGYLSERVALINHRIEELLPFSSREARVLPAMRHSLLAGGKRLRPVLCMAAAEAVGSGDSGVLDAGCAIEMIHTYSLIHDDLPALDNDQVRRGLPTCHAAYGEATAILAGDALLTAAFEVLANAGLSDHRRANRWLTVTRTIAGAAGYRGMIEGQMRDISSEEIRLSVGELEAMHSLKTGALIAASVLSGCILAGGNPIQEQQLLTYANNIGLAFQVVDDILNIEGDPALLGKAVGTDLAMNKNTYPSLLGVERSKQLAAALVTESLQAISDFDTRSHPLRAIAGYIVNRNR